VVDNVRCEINIAKNRSGQIGKIPFNWNKAIYKFTEFVDENKSSKPQN
jgi:replicative DNA helicase